MDLTGIANVGEFYSHHYLDALLENDLRGLFAAWKEEDAATPDKRVERCAAAFFSAKRDASRARTLAERYAPSHRFHVDLLEALGYPYQQQVRYLLDGEAIPLLGGVDRDGRPFLWLAETPFAAAEESPLEQSVVAEQYPADPPLTPPAKQPQGKDRDLDKITTPSLHAGRFCDGCQAPTGTGGT
jgi:hypothetical protein